MKKILEKIHLPNWLIFILILVLILRIPSFFEPYYYGDEMIYLSLGQGIRHGIPLYSGLHDNKPPFLYVISAIAGNLFWFKAILVFWNLATIALFWKLSKIFFAHSLKAHKFAVFIFAILTTIPLLEGNIANAELFMIAPTILAFLTLLTKKLNARNIFISGLFFSFASLFKIPAAAELGVIIFFWIIQSEFKKQELNRVLKNSAYLLLGFIIPIGLTFVWFGLAGSFKEYITAAFLQNFGYVSSWRPGDVQKSFIARNSPLILRTLFVLAGSFILFVKRKRLSKNFIFLCLWILFSLFAVTLSERPYPHYLIQSTPAISLLVAFLVFNKTIEQSLSIIPLSLVFLVTIVFKFWYYPILPYYSRFLSLATNNITKEEYLQKFDKNLSRNYKIADFLAKSSGPKERVFILGDSPAIYALSRRFPPIKYVADYHIKDFSNAKELMSILEKDKPPFVVVLEYSKPFSEIIRFVRNEYIQISEIEGAAIYKNINI